MFINNILAVGALATLVCAIPLHQHHEVHQKRDVVSTTTVVMEYITQTSTTTVFIHAGQTPDPNAPADPSPQAPANPNPSPKPPRTTHLTHTITVVPQPAPTGQAPNTAGEASVKSLAASPPASPSPAAPSAPPASPEPHTSNPAPTQAPSGNGGGSGGSGQHYSGDITYYTPGLGSCGVTNSEGDMIVALAENMMLAEWPSGNPNDNPYCGRSITISYGGHTVQATIEDTCPGCAGASLDLTPALFEKFGALSIGRISGVQWWFN